jgi:cyclopropane fatty-acyl-phospholipid synthase-like methyltransferase
LFFRRKPDGGTVVRHVFGNGFLDTIDDVFWMLPFSRVRQAQLVCQDHNISMDDWNRRLEKIMQEHRQAGAREQLTARWKSWVASDSFKEKMAAKEPAERGGEDIPERDE